MLSHLLTLWLHLSMWEISMYNVSMYRISTSLICNLPNHKFYQHFLSSIGGDAHRTWLFSRQQCEFDTEIAAAGTLSTTQHIYPDDLLSSGFHPTFQRAKLAVCMSDFSRVWILCFTPPLALGFQDNLYMRSCHLIDIGILGYPWIPLVHAKWNAKLPC